MAATSHGSIPAAAGSAGRRRHWAVPAVLLLGLALSALASWRTRLAVHAEAQARFVGESERLAAELVRRITQSSYALHGLRASMAVSGRMRRVEFRSWVAQRDLAREFPGIRGLGFIERVPRPELAEYQARERADSAPDFTVQTSGEAADLFVITHIEPVERNRPAVGLDVGAERVRREGAERAIDTGRLSLTGPVVLVQDEQRGPGWLLFLPVFRPGASVASQAERRAALIGLLYAPIAAAEVLAPLAEFAEHRLRFQLSDEQAASSLLYDSAAGPTLDRWPAPRFSQQRSLQIAGRVMTLQIASTPLFEARMAGWVGSVVLLAGLALSLLLTFGVARLQASRDEAEARSQQVSRDLAEHEKLIQLMIDSIPAQLSYWDRTLRCRLVNRAVCVAWGRRREELLGTPLAATPLGAKFLAQAQPAIDAALRGSEQQHESSETLPSGRVESTLTHFLPDLRGEDTPGLVILTLDISELKSAQNAAQQASAAKSRFLSSMSHEMRTPMNAVIGMLELLRSTPLSPRQDDYAKKAERAASSLLLLINDILDFSKIEAGKMRLDPRPFSMRALLEDVQVVLAASLGDKPVALRLHCDPAVPPLLFGDDLRLRQVLTNLGDNAIKFTHRGEIELRVDQLGIAQGIAELEVSVRDTGIGISPEAMLRLFDDYAQASSTTTRHFGGTGLGLSICRRLARLLDSELKVESVPGEGSRFHLRLRLPLTTVSPADASRASSSSDDVTALPLAGLRLLLVEDNELNQQLAKELLAARGAAVTVVENGLLAVQKLEQAESEFDAVLMDVQMPVLDGYAATQRIREKHGNRLPIIAMTASVFEKDREAARQAGMDGYLSKPIDTRALVDTLLRHISKRQRRSNESLLALAATSATPPTPVRPVAPEAPAAPAAPEAPASACTAAEPPRFLDPAKAIELLGGDRELYFSLVPPFCERLRVVAAQLQSTTEVQTADDQLRLLHTLRGMASTMGAEGLAAQAKAAERIGHDTDRALDAAALAGVRQAISRTLAELSSLTDKPPA